MIEIYNDNKYFEGVDGIDFVDFYFAECVGDVGVFSEDDIQDIRRFENAEIISGKILKDNLRKDNRYSEFLLDDMSSGVKTLLLLSLMNQDKIEKRPYINITECGQNILEAVFELAEKVEIPCILQHIQFNTVRDFKYKLNGREIITSTESLIDRIVEIY